MRSNRLGCLSGMGILAAFITALVIAGYAYASGGLMYNPGPLNAQPGELLGGVRSHAELGGDCEACHVAPWENAHMADRCADCHGGIAAQMRDVASMHGKMLHDNPGLSCRHCHPEHRGPDAPLSELEDAEFPHEIVGYSLKGHQLTTANAAFTCDDCHHGDISTFALDSCQICHRQSDPTFTAAHAIEYGPICLDCHDGVDRFGKSFKHDFTFQLTGKHSDLICSKCHTGARNVADFSKIPTDCNACHRQDEPHAGRLGTGCEGCHSTEGWTPANFDHDLAAFKLEGEHAETTCEQCHTDKIYKDTPSECYACHKEDDEHAGRFGTDCSACHQPTDWEAVTFDHNLSAFKLEGAHAKVECEQCHIDRVYEGTPTDCYSCHKDEDKHGGRFGTVCNACHQVTSWEDVTFDHNQSNFPLTGRHAGLPCESCHINFQFTGVSTACAACHGEPAFHAGLFSSDCATCHTTQNWSAKYTGPHPGIADEGGRGVNHGGASCRDCHTQNLSTATCLACHDSNNPDDDGGGGGGGDD